MLGAEGFVWEFDPSFCQSCGGKCCTGDSGLIWIDDSEIAALAKYLNFEIEQFKEQFLFIYKGKFSIKEKPYKGGQACIFFDEKEQNCGIYEYRPKQCRSFPFWEHFKTNLEELKQECIGVKFL
ncbi:YkgJ family cysteine cluster protein [Campylobacter sp. 9BO]|uniref:YkgJ family cysteine cluster protein n=1 Tax=Campylobacter sp. 9BO TaxID=3424759 RepID=UPI003D33FFF3